MFACLTIALLQASTCSPGGVIGPPASSASSVEPTEELAAVVRSDRVDDLRVTDATGSSISLSWTQVDNGLGAPAEYRLKYAPPPIEWRSAEIGCQPTLTGETIGLPMSCTVEGLTAGTVYEFQLMSFRRSSRGAWIGAVYSNVASGSTTEPREGERERESEPREGATESNVALGTTSASRVTAWAGSDGIWLGAAEIAALPTSGPAWTNLLDEANGSCGTVDLADQAQRNNVCILSKALVFAKTGTASYRSDVLSAIRQIVDAPPYEGRALALGRELAAYVVAADLVGLATHDPQLDSAFRRELRELLTTYTHSGPRNLVACHERRPNNWGTMCGASRVAVAAYLGDATELDRTARVFRGWLGERSYYAGFDYGDLSWQCDPDRPVGINPRGCTRHGRDLGGVLPDDQRRAGPYSWPPPRENYVWEALQGAVVQAVILERAGYPAFEWGDRALLRAARWLHDQLGYAAEGDDTWQPHLLNFYYGSSFPAPVPTSPGKIMGWSDWTHR